MAYITHSQAIEHNGAYWLINSAKSGVCTKQLKAYLRQVDAMLSHHSRIIVIRFDLHQYEYTDDSKHGSRFFSTLTNRLKRQYNLTRVGYGWVREQEKAKHQHYHAFIVLNGHKVNYPARVFGHVRELWQLHYDGHVSYVENCYYHFHRDDEEAYSKVVYRLSYLAKGRGKGYKPEQAKNYGCSRIPHGAKSN